MIKTFIIIPKVEGTNMSFFNRRNEIIPIFFASDNNYAPYLAVAIKSLLANASTDYFYKIHILTTNLDKDLCVKLKMCVSGVPLRTHAVPHISNFTRLARFAGKGKFYSQAITKRTELPPYRLL